MMVSVFSEPLNIDVGAESAILINADTGVVLYEKNAHAIQFPASITKIATALYTIHVYGDKLHTPITAEHDSVAWVTMEAKKRSNYTLPAHWLEPGATHIGIKRGEQLPLFDLLNGVMISSANDASNVIAQYIGGTVPNFMSDLNKYLKSIGCKNTNFCNPHGLHHPDHQTTAYDMSVIAREAMKYPEFREIVKTVRYTRPKTNKQQQPTTLVNSNRLLRKGKLHYSKALGIKTGYTSIARHTFVAASQENGRTLIAVLIKEKEKERMFKDAKKMFEAAYNQTRVQRVLLRAGPQKYVLNHPQASREIGTYLDKDVCVDFFPAEEPNLSCKLYWKNFQPPVKQGEHVGSLEITASDGRYLQSVPLYAGNSAKQSWTYWFKSFFSKAEEKPIQTVEKKGSFWKLAGMSVAVLFLVGVLLGMRKPR